MKKVQFDKSCDVQKSEMRRERAIKEAERRARQIQDSDLDDFTRSINGPPFSSPILSNNSFSSPRFSQSLRDVNVPPLFNLPPPQFAVGSGRPSNSPFRSSLRSVINDPVHPNTDSYKTALCHEWREKESCSYGENCKYAHGISELRPPIQASPHYKTVLCRNYTKYGDCPHGSKCKFVHRRDDYNAVFSSSASPFIYSPLNFASSYSNTSSFNPLAGLPFNTHNIMRQQASFNSSRQLE